MLKNVLLIYNPLAGSQGIQGRLDYIISLFTKQGILLHILPTANYSGEIVTSLIRDKIFRYDYVVLSGGDGTMNHFVTLMMDNDINVPVGIIPTGTCNDFARCLHIPQDLDACLNIILRGKTTRVDIGKTSGKKYLLDTCGGGMFMDSSVKTPSIYKQSFGPLAYYFHGLGELTNLRAFDVSVKTDTQEIHEKIILFLVLNGNHAAGFENLLDSADLSDGFMDILLIKECSYLDLANLFFRLLSKDLSSDPHVIHTIFKSCRIEGPKEFSLSIDGEEGGSLPLRIDVLPKALEVFIA